MPGAPSQSIVTSKLGERTLPVLPTGPIVLIAGNTFRHSIPGGGGYGNPLERDPALILEDVLDGKVSAYQALSHYGVVIKAIGVTGTDFIVDELATAKAKQASIT